MLATLLELLQVAPQNRSADRRDILWSTLGALTTTLVPAFLLKLIRRYPLFSSPHHPHDAHDDILKNVRIFQYPT